MPASWIMFSKKIGLGHLIVLLALIGRLYGKLDIENISVVDYPDEDTCDYDIYLWEVINTDSHWEEDKIDYYKLFDVVPKITPKSEIKESYLNMLSFWDSWCTLCNIKKYDKERGEKIIHKGYQTITHPKKREAYDNDLKKAAEKGSTSTFKRVREWLKTVGIVVVMVALIYTIRTFRKPRTTTTQPPIPKHILKTLQNNKGGSNIHTIKGRMR